MNYWLMKTEPSTFGIDHLANKPKKTAMWDGVRNYQARNMLRDDFRKGDQAFIYHSSAEETGIAGIMQVVGTAYPDPTQFDKKNDHYDPVSKREDPRWVVVDGSPSFFEVTNSSFASGPTPRWCAACRR